jgi:hypothetical protein
MRGAQELLGDLQLPGHGAPVLVLHQHRPQRAQPGTAAEPVEQHEEVALQGPVQSGGRGVGRQVRHTDGRERDHDHGQQRERGRALPGHRVEGKALHSRRPHHRSERQGGKHEARAPGVAERGRRELDRHPHQRRARQPQGESLGLRVSPGESRREADPEREHEQPEAGPQRPEDGYGRRSPVPQRMPTANPVGHEPGRGHAGQDQREPQPAARAPPGPPASVRQQEWPGLGTQQRGGEPQAERRAGTARGV